MQRSRGAARVAFALQDGRAVLRALSQSGPAKVMLPRILGALPEAVFLNTAGGLAADDQLAYAIDIAAGCYATATTQTAERAYRAAPGAGPAQVTQLFTVADGGRLDWLPQETILYDQARLARSTTIALSGNAQCLMTETLILGRKAMGEAVTRLDLNDMRRITQDGSPVLIEALRLTDAALMQAGSPAILGGATTIATVVLIAPHAADLLEQARAALGVEGVEGAASALPGRLIVRLMAADGWAVRCQMARLLPVLRDLPLPRVWQM